MFTNSSWVFIVKHRKTTQNKKKNRKCFGESWVSHVQPYDHTVNTKQCLLSIWLQSLYSKTNVHLKCLLCDCTFTVEENLFQYFNMWIEWVRWACSKVLRIQIYYFSTVFSLLFHLLLFIFSIEMKLYAMHIIKKL